MSVISVLYYYIYYSSFQRKVCKQVILVIFCYYLRYKMEEKPKSNVTMPQIQLLIYTMARGPNNLIES